MHKLVTLRSPPMVQALMERLEDASIVAFCASDNTVGDLYFGGITPTAVWLNDAADADRARQILSEVQASIVRTQCRACGYDLQGHGGATTCPECGSSQTAPTPDRECAVCHEPVPQSFEICWNCGTDMTQQKPPTAYTAPFCAGRSPSDN